VILTLCYEGFRGVNQALIHLEAASGLTRHIIVREAGGRSAEALFLRDHIRQSRPRLVLFGGWSTAYEPMLEALPEGVPAAVYWTSSGGQISLAKEESTLHALLGERRLSHLFFMARDLAEILATARTDVDWLPAVMAAETLSAPAAQPTDPPGIGLFCAADERARKNVTNCILALAAVRRPFHLHLNGLTECPFHRDLLRDLRIRHSDHGWMEAARYAQVRATLSLGLQASFAESHGYVALEHVLLGIPVLATRMVPALDPLPRRLKDPMLSDWPDSPRRLARRIERLLDGHPLEEARAILLAANDKALARVRATLTPWL
jgi:hypothetical protein